MTQWQSPLTFHRKSKRTVCSSPRHTITMGEAKRRDIPAIVAASVLAAFMLVYLTRPDALAAITIWPFWVWLVPGALPLAIKFNKERARARLSVLGLWLVIWAVLAEEPLSLARAVVPPRAYDLRVVSLNCASSVEAAMETLDMEPDIVLLQESMGTDSIEKVRKALGENWTMVVGIDASILARGRLVVVDVKRSINFTAARLDGTLIVSLRLAPPVFRLDYWNPECWSHYAANKRARRVELRRLAEFVAREADGAPLILGGDFNTPPDHTITEAISGIANDAYARAGRGWGPTAINNYPMVRIDQIWASDKYEPVNSFSKKTLHSDHRMALADFVTDSK